MEELARLVGPGEVAEVVVGAAVTIACHSVPGAVAAGAGEAVVVGVVRAETVATAAKVAVAPSAFFSSTRPPM
jgi:hypothetical protein